MSNKITTANNSLLLWGLGRTIAASCDIKSSAWSKANQAELTEEAGSIYDEAGQYLLTAEPEAERVTHPVPANWMGSFRV